MAKQWRRGKRTKWRATRSEYDVFNKVGIRRRDKEVGLRNKDFYADLYGQPMYDRHKSSPVVPKGRSRYDKYNRYDDQDVPW